MADLSGNGPNNDQFMGIVIGTQEHILKIIKYLECDPDHPIKTTQERSKLCSKLKFDQENIIAFCFQINKDQIIAKTVAKTTGSKTTQNKIFNTYNYALHKLISKDLNDFTLQYKIGLRDVRFECDSDCRDFLKLLNFYYVEKKNFHFLSDLVAWSNNRNRKIDGVNERNLVDALEREMNRVFKK